MRTILAIAATLSAGVLLAHAQTNGEKLGTVNFETSCKPEAQKLFNQGMLYQHSFWYRASQTVFEDALKADPQCGIAYWGIALSMLWNPHVPTPAKNLTDGAAAMAASIAPSASPWIAISRAPSRAAPLNEIWVLYARENSSIPRTMRSRTGRMSANSTAAAPRSGAPLRDMIRSPPCRGGQQGGRRRSAVTGPGSGRRRRGRR